MMNMHISPDQKKHLFFFLTIRPNIIKHFYFWDSKEASPFFLFSQSAFYDHSMLWTLKKVKEYAKEVRGIWGVVSAYARNFSVSGE